MKKNSKDKKSFLRPDEQEENQAHKYGIGDLEAFRGLWKYMSQYKWHFFFAIFIMMVSSFSGVFSARLMGILVEDGLMARNYDYAMKIGGGIVLLEGLSILLIWQGRKILSTKSASSIYDIRCALFEQIQKLPLGFYDRQPQGRIVTRITHDVEGIEEFFTSSMGRLVQAIFMSSAAIFAMLVTDFKLGLILVLAMAPALLFIFSTRNLVRNTNRKMSRLSSSLNARLSEYISGIEVIRAFGLEDWSKKQFNESVADHQESQFKANMLYSWSRPLVSFLCTFPIIGLVWFGGNNVLAGTMGVGLFITFVRYCERFFHPIMMIAREIHVVQTAFTNAERVNTFLTAETEEKVLGANGKIAIRDNLKGHLIFDSLWMAYDDENWILKNLNFEIQPGEKIGLVGRTGCGKSTTVSLISRLYEYQRGDILIDGISIKDYDRQYLRSKVGFVSQDAIIVKGTLRENLIHDENTDEGEVLNACEVTGLSKVMKNSKMTLDSEILEAGANLSVGERQLISLTRVLIDNPAILIMDEATANIDPFFEELIHHAVDTVMKGRTCLFIAHRLSTLKSCDRILVFEKGEVVEEGTEELLHQRKGHFYQLHQAALEGKL